MSSISATQRKWTCVQREKRFSILHILVVFSFFPFHVFFLSCFFVLFVSSVTMCVCLLLLFQYVLVKFCYFFLFCIKHLFSLNVLFSLSDIDIYRYFYHIFVGLSVVLNLLTKACFIHEIVKDRKKGKSRSTQSITVYQFLCCPFFFLSKDNA